MTEKTNHLKPPQNTRRIWRVADLPSNRDDGWYEILNENEPPRHVLLRKRQRQVIDLLRSGPVYCASPVRLSDIVHVLKREAGLRVHTEYFPGDTETGAGTYGVYTLISKVRPIVPQEVAA